MAGDDRPPLTHYSPGAAEIELIVPDLPRRHASGATVEILGASAQKVADLQPLLVEPIDLEVEGIGLVRLPNPGAYLLQKMITLGARRTLEKKGKDALSSATSFCSSRTTVGSGARSSSRPRAC